MSNEVGDKDSEGPCGGAFYIQVKGRKAIIFFVKKIISSTNLSLSSRDATRP